jgi:hypothetical protein
MFGFQHDLSCPKRSVAPHISSGSADYINRPATGSYP